jgi:hypothetical protein
MASKICRELLNETVVHFEFAERIVFACYGFKNQLFPQDNTCWLNSAAS